MEVIHVVLGKANPDRMNGVNKVVNELANKQVAAGIDVTLWGITDNTVHDYPQRKYRTLLFRKSFNPFIVSADIEEAIQHLSKDVVFHLHGGFIPFMYSLSRMLKKYGIPYVFTPHGSYNVLAMKHNAIFKTVYCSFFERFLTTGAANVHLLGTSEVQGIKAWCKNVMPRVIPYGFQLPAQQSCAMHAHGMFRIGFCGRIDVFTKGLDMLVKGFSKFHKDYPRSVLDIIGDGDGMQELKKLVVKERLDDAVIFHGSKFGNEKFSIIKQLDVFAHPSRNEGLPTSVLEAASLGLPCLVTEATNVGDSINKYHAGLVVGDCTAINISRGLSSLYNDLAMDKKLWYAHNATRMVSEVYNWDSLIGQYKDMYHHAIAG